MKYTDYIRGINIFDNKSIKAYSDLAKTLSANAYKQRKKINWEETAIGKSKLNKSDTVSVIQETVWCPF